MIETIRSAQKTDLPYLYKICFRTGFSGGDARNYYTNEFLLGQYYAAPYIFFDSDCCYVLVNKKGIPSGYIVGTRDSSAFRTWMDSDWLPMLSAESALQTDDSVYEKSLKKMILGFSGQLLTPLQKKLQTDFPAHLHIDIIPELQGKGFGKKLVGIFVQNLKNLSVSGVHLGVDSANTAAIKFYEAIGFMNLGYTTDCLYMGMKL
ncbi:MAG: GNAT family N-acetyltransferase [Treponema sp.]|jgi:ribosomal protein S18 acetylase RimI-like enzyme|nr:GNAT family N-acetyltransferase [Treponema sp.]